MSDKSGEGSAEGEHAGARPVASPALPLAILLIAIAAAFVALLDDYGPGYDEYIGNTVYGERSLAFLMTGDSAFMALDQPAPEGLVVPGHADLGAHPSDLEGAHRQGQGAAVVAALTCRIFFREWGWLPAVEAHHLANLLFLLPAVALLFLVAWRTLGPLAASLAAVLLFAQPRFVGHLVVNGKDLPEACLFGAALLTFWKAWTAGSRGWWCVSGLLTGFAVTVKVNAVFVPVVLLAWILLGRRLVPRPATVGVAWWAAWPVLAAAGLVLTWPLLWVDPGALGRFVAFILEQGHTGTARFNLATFREWLAVTPEIVLAGVAAAAVTGWYDEDRRRRSLLLLLTLWLVVPLARANLPGARHYDGIRHVLEITLPTAALAAYGWTRVIELRRQQPFLSRVGLALPLGIVLGMSILPWTQGLHPYELAWFNPTSGGYAGAVARDHKDAGDYWAASYRQGIAWLNESLPPGSTVAVPWAEHLVRGTRGSVMGLREDLVLLPLWRPFDFDEPQALARYERALSRGPVHVMFVSRNDSLNAVSRHALEHGVQVLPGGTLDGERVLNVYRVEGLP